MTITDARFAKNGEPDAIAYASTNAKVTKSASEMNWYELLEALMIACDKEIASNNAKIN